MKDKIILILGAICMVLFLIIGYAFKRIDGLKTDVRSLKEDVQKRDQTIKDMEKVNELYIEATKENEKFKERMSDDNSDNLSVRPASYILDRLRKD